jgi:hypothetical protein
MLNVHGRTIMTFRTYVLGAIFFVALAGNWEEIKDIAGWQGTVGADLREVHGGCGCPKRIPNVGLTPDILSLSSVMNIFVSYIYDGYTTNS